MWQALDDICWREQTSINMIASVVARTKARGSSLTAALRVFVMGYYRCAATEDGHVRAGHGARESLRTNVATALKLNGAAPFAVAKVFTTVKRLSWR